MTLRHTVDADIAALAAIADATLFPGELLGPMVHSNLDGDGTCWFTALDGDTPVGFCFAAPEEMTQAAWNMKALAVDPSKLRAGHGARLVRALEVDLLQRGAQVLVIDTASGDEQIAARAFYNANGYTLSGTIPSFWDAATDKVTFWKTISA